MKKTILSILCLLMSLCNYAYDFEVDGFYYNIISLQDLTVQLTCSGPSSYGNKDYNGGYDDNKNYEATYTNDFNGNFVVPKTVEYYGKTYTVTSIHTLAFFHCNIGTLIIPETVEEVAMEYVFLSYSPGTMTTDMYSSTSGLLGNFRRLIIEDSEKPIKCLGSLIDHTRRYYFAMGGVDGPGLHEPSVFEWIYVGGVTEYVYLGRQIEAMDASNGGYVVSGSSYYSKIEFGENVKSLSNACAGNKAITSVTLPSTITSLYATFVGCTALETITIPSSVKSLSSTFYGCTSLKSVDAIGVEFIRDDYHGDTFAGCENLETVNLPMLHAIFENTSTFSNRLFYGCTSLKSIVFAQGLVTMVGSGVFSGSGIESIVLPSTLVQIGKNVNHDNDRYNCIFTDCPYLKTITVCNPVPVKIEESNFDINTYLTATLKVPVGAAEAYRNADVWKNFFNIEEDASITDDVFTIYEEKNYGYLSGADSIEIDVEEALPAYNYGGVNYKFAKKGEPVTIKIVPYSRYDKLMRFTINDVDVTEDVDDNVYQTTVVGGMAINAEFAYCDQSTEVTIPEAGYTAYVTEFDAEFQTPWCQAYKITEATTSGVILEPIETAKKGTAVILQGKDSYNTYIYEIGIAEKHIDNLFKAGGEMVGDGKTIYALGNKNGVVGFYLVKEGVTVPTDKGYLVIDPSQQPNGVKEFIPFGGEATGIETIEEKSSDKEDVIYNLAGQRVTQPTKSGIYIVNGKKVFINK